MQRDMGTPSRARWVSMTRRKRCRPSWISSFTTPSRTGEKKQKTKGKKKKKKKDQVGAGGGHDALKAVQAQLYRIVLLFTKYSTILLTKKQYCTPSHHCEELVGCGKHHLQPPVLHAGHLPRLRGGTFLKGVRSRSTAEAQIQQQQNSRAAE